LTLVDPRSLGDRTIWGACATFTDPWPFISVSSSHYNFGILVAILWGEEKHMRYIKFLALPALMAALLSMPSTAHAQVSINIGAAPACPYGYYDFAPYNCAPYGYYGPEWFSGGVFIGAGPWFHGAHDFYGHVDNRFDPHHGYHGPHPERGDRAFNHFRGNEMRDGRGHAGGHGGHGGGHR
jgi:hypothetical protein